MKKAIMNTMIILFALAMCVGCGQSSEQKEESVPTDAVSYTHLFERCRRMISFPRKPSHHIEKCH